MRNCDKRRASAWLIACAMTLTVFVLPTSATTIPAEWDMAIALANNYNNGIPGKEIPASAALNETILLSYTSAIIPEKCTLLTSWSSKNGKTSYSYSLKPSDSINTPKALKKAKQISDSLVRPNMSQREILKAFHDYIVLNTSYDTSVLSTGMTPKTMYAYTISGPLLYGRAVCDGYTSAMMSLCHTVGIPCYKIESRTMNHSWAAVFDDTGHLRFIDATYDDPIPDRPGVAGEDYFMLTPAELQVKNHRYDRDGFGISIPTYEAFLTYVMEKRGLQTKTTPPVDPAAQRAADALNATMTFYMLLACPQNMTEVLFWQLVDRGVISKTEVDAFAKFFPTN